MRLSKSFAAFQRERSEYRARYSEITQIANRLQKPIVPPGTRFLLIDDELSVVQTLATLLAFWEIWHEILIFEPRHLEGLSVSDSIHGLLLDHDLATNGLEQAINGCSVYHKIRYHGWYGPVGSTSVGKAGADLSYLGTPVLHCPVKLGLLVHPDESQRVVYVKDFASFVQRLAGGFSA